MSQIVITKSTEESSQPKGSPMIPRAKDLEVPGMSPRDRPRRLSAPHPSLANSCPSSPVHTPLGTSRPLSPNLSVKSETHVRLSTDAWVCPNDRQLALRAKLHSGWSVKTATINHWKQPEPINANEHKKIVDVIQKAEAMELAEQKRVGHLMERLENMRRNAAGDGVNNCILCGERFGFFTRQKNLLCTDCQRGVCTKCGVDYCVGKETLWLCKLCSETREMWKKSGAWFFKELPKQEAVSLGKGHNKERRFTVYKPVRNEVEKDEPEENEGEESSEDEAGGGLAKRLPATKLGMEGEGRRESDSDASRHTSMLSIYSSMESGLDLDYSRPPSVCSLPRHPPPNPRGSPSPRGSPYRHRPPHPRGHGPRGPRGYYPRPLPPGSRGPRLGPPSYPRPPGSPRSPGSPRPRQNSPRGSPRFRHMRGFSRGGGPPTLPPAPPISPPSHSMTDIQNQKDSGSTSDSDLTENPVCCQRRSPSPDLLKTPRTKLKSENSGVFSTLRRLSTVSRRKGRRKAEEEKEIDIEVISEHESSTETITSGYQSRQESSRSHGSDDNNSSPRTPDASNGILEFALIYDEINELLLVNILRAKGLKGLDVNGLCDSYCKVSLVPPVKKVSQQRTRTVSRTVTPEYTSLLHFPNTSKEDLSSLHMHVAILDEDLSGDHLLAEARISLTKVNPQMQKHFQVCLHKPSFEDGNHGFITNNDCGKIEISLAFYSQHGTLKVGVVRASGLAASDPQQQTSDPFVKVVLQPEAGPDCRRKTSIKYKTLDPEFNEQFVFLTNITDLPKQSLSITVWDRDQHKQNDYIGGLILGLNAKCERLKHWANLIKHPNKVHAKTHSLSANYLH